MMFLLGLICGILLAFIVTVQARVEADKVVKVMDKIVNTRKARRSDVIPYDSVVEAQHELYERNEGQGKSTDLSDIL